KSRGLSYQWRLFIPLVVSLWVIIFAMTYWQYRNERNYKRELFTSQLELVNQRIVAAYETNLDPNAFVSFVVKYYRDSPLYDQLRVSIYQDGQLIKAWGEPIGLDEDEQKMGKGITRTPEMDRSVSDTRPEDGFFFYNITNSKDKHLTVCTVLPMDSEIEAAALPSSDIFQVVIVLAIVVTVFAWWSTRYLSKNLRILRAIAENAAADTNFIPPMHYPHDELGDISRKISQMYNERSEAMERQKREHEIALHAIEEKARSKRQLTNNINHELRTPIGVIKGYIDTILENPDMDDASRTHFLRKASEHVDRLVNLIADVSAITRLEEGGDMISTEELDYHDVAYTIASDLDESGAMGNMVFKWNVPLDCKIMGNYNLLSGMLLN
ncbi:MAG: HAMP domain-containing histidine kinase, partial [Muribaculaceae bacterium]|nr:HAMP domain-containing histidine kinase [Muribaculaceae bacterium]